MSGGDRGKGIASLDWVAPLLGFIMGCLLAWGIGYLQARDTYGRESAARSYQESAEAHAKRACIGMEPTAAFECIYKHVEASREASQSEYDLKAQQRAAMAALVAAIVAGLTLIASVVGIWFVRETLNASLAATEQAIRGNEIALLAVKAEHRPDLQIIPRGPYVKTDKEPTRAGARNGNWQYVPIICPLEIVNNGNRPVKIIDYYLGLSRGKAVPKFKEVAPFIINPQENAFLVANDCDVVKGHYPREWPITIFIIHSDEELTEYRFDTPAIVGYIIYDDALSVRRIKHFAFKPRLRHSSTEFDEWGGQARNFEQEITATA